MLRLKEGGPIYSIEMGRFRVSKSGCCSEKNLAYLAAPGQSGHAIDCYIATGKQKHDEYRQPCSRGPLPRNATRVERMKRKLQTKVGRAIYATRKTIVEPVFGQIKEARGFRRFLLRGLAKVRGEWALVCLTHNNAERYTGTQCGYLFSGLCSMK